MSEIGKLSAEIKQLTETVTSLRIEVAAIKALQCPNPGACNEISEREEKIFERLGKLELWAATRTGQITVIAAICSIIGLAVIEGIISLVKHFR